MAHLLKCDRCGRYSEPMDGFSENSWFPDLYFKVTIRRSNEIWGTRDFCSPECFQKFASELEEIPGKGVK